MTDINLDVTIEEANLILGALGEQPFAKVFGLIAKIQQQAQAQLGTDEAIGVPAPDVAEHGSDLDGG